jgi:CDP-glucose 4,6-dehydratase
VRDYFYIEDAAEAYILLAEKLSQNPGLSGDAFNFSNETPLSVLQLVERILELMESHLKPIIRNEASNEIRRQYLNAKKARRVLGWRPLFTLDEGLRRTIKWYRTFLEHPGE